MQSPKTGRSDQLPERTTLIFEIFCDFRNHCHYMLYLQLQLCLFLMCMNAIHVFAAWSTLRLGTQYLHTLSVYYTLCSAAIPTSAHSEGLVDTEIYTFFATAKATSRRTFTLFLNSQRYPMPPFGRTLSRRRAAKLGNIVPAPNHTTMPLRPHTC